MSYDIYLLLCRIHNSGMTVYYINNNIVIKYYRELRPVRAASGRYLYLYTRARRNGRETEDD